MFGCNPSTNIISASTGHVRYMIQFSVEFLFNLPLKYNYDFQWLIFKFVLSAIKKESGIPFLALKQLNLTANYILVVEF